jgi:hypothetical protein
MRLSENELFFPRLKKAEIITTPLKYTGTGIHTLKVFEAYNLSLTQRLGENSHSRTAS